jgi:translation initiation factor 1
MGKDSWRDLLCPKCHQLKSTCTCKNEPLAPSKSTVVRVGRETKGRRGKGVTTISDVPLDENGLAEFAAKLKQRLGTGGTVKDGRIEIQGDQRDRIAAELEGLGYKVKRVGG